MSNNIKSAIKTFAIADGKENVIQQLQVKYYDAIKNCGKLGYYGIYGNAPKGSLVIVMQINGQEEVLYGIEDDVNNRPRDLKEGEVMLYNTLTKNYIFLKEDGDTEIFAKKDMHIKPTGKVIIDGDVVINGNLNVTGTASAGVVEAGNGADLKGSDTVSATKGIVTGA